jgi:hypothetical protein
MQSTEAGPDDQHFGILLALKNSSIHQAISAGVGVIAGDVLGRLLEHAGLVNFYTYIFMKKYTLNFTTATGQGTKKIPPRKTRAGLFLSGSVIEATLPTFQATGIIGSAEASAVTRSAAGG